MPPNHAAFSHPAWLAPWVSSFIVIFLGLAGAGLGQGLSSPANGGLSADGIWQDAGKVTTVESTSRKSRLPIKYRVLRLNPEALQTLLRKAPLEFRSGKTPACVEMTLPMPDGTFARFCIEESPIMEPALAAKFPQIRTYLGQGLTDPTATTRIDWTPRGFHAMVLSAGDTVYVDPQPSEGDVQYFSYYRRDLPADDRGWSCRIHGGSDSATRRLLEDYRAAALSASGPELSWGTTLRTYRLAVAATAQYTSFYGGTVSGALAGIVTTINRVNGIYEKEVAVRMVLIANETAIIYTNPATQPYTDNNPDALIEQNPANLNSVIGANNYDIGHVFSTGGGGIAGLGVVCGPYKGEGVTGTSQPVGDAFDVDYVAHEMGHQFDADHTFNGTTGACGGGNRNASTAYEPGSASTIMGYAGICGAENLQLHSDPYFHGASLDQIITYTTTGAGNICPLKSSTGNIIPSINPGSSYSIPIGTPFALTASGNDPNGDALTYGWEQYDLGAQSPPSTDNGQRPLFRSFLPTASPSRTFPKLSDILNNTSTFGEVLPSLSRSMKMRITVRDNRAGGGGVNSASVSINVDAGSGPFSVTQPAAGITWSGGSTRLVTWNVNNTNKSPVSCAAVNIRMSIDGGNAFPYLWPATRQTTEVPQ